MSYLIQLRNDTAANWTSVNPILAAGEAGFEIDTGIFKIGDGASAWTALAATAGTTPPATPAGIISQFAGSTAPDGYLLCHGQSLSTTAYSDLFAAIGYTYGGSGSSFAVPNLQNRIPVGKGTDVEFDTLGETGGEKTVAITEAQMPSHTHTTPNHSHTFSTTTSENGSHQHTLIDSYNEGISSPSGQSTVFAGNRQKSGYEDTRYVQAAGSHTHTLSGTTSNSSPTTNSAGSGNAHNNLQPYIVVNYIIKT